MRVPEGMVTLDLGSGFDAGLSAAGRKLSGRGDELADGVSETNLSDATSARSYFCTDEPTWKLISVSVPPMNLPLMRLPFFSSKESAHETDVASKTRTK